MKTNFTILKGKHRSGFHFRPIFKLKDRYQAKFILFSDCWFEPQDLDDLDVNKLWGISIGGFHHKNSIRIGWRPTKEKNIIELLAYYYNGGKRFFHSLCQIKTDTSYYSTIGFDYDKNLAYISISKEVNKISEFTFNFPKCKLGYFLFPYFGGNKVAPNDMNFFLTFS